MPKETYQNWRLLDGIEGDEDISSSEGTNSACLGKQLQYGETNKDNKKESLEKQENTKAWKDKKRNSPIGSHMINHKIE